MRRREFLATAGAASVAGCGSGESSDDEPTAASGSSDGAAGDGSGTQDGGGSDDGGTPALPAERPLRGVSISPVSFDAEGFQAFFDEAGEAGPVVRWAGDWAELGGDGGPPAAILTTAREHGLVPMMETGVFSAGAEELFRPLTEERTAAYVEGAAAFCEAHAPPYLGIGVEIDFHHRTDPDSFSTFVDLFAETYEAVKAVSPDTLVYTGFQYEQLRGLRGGLFGGENDPETADWELLDRFPDADLTAITSYPGLIYRDPAEIPSDYYAALADRTDRPIAITETGWTHRTIAEGWESDEAEQAAFVERLSELTDGIDVETLIWLWLYEQQVSEATVAFQGMSLRRDDGSARPAWDAWIGQ